MVRSMTGYAQAKGESEGWGMSVTLKALNHRFLDLRLRLPAELEAWEPRFRAQIRNAVRRGHLEVEFRVLAAASPLPQVDRELLRSLLQLDGELRKEFHLQGEPDLAGLLRLPGVLRPPERAPDSIPAERLGGLGEELLGEALSGLDQMRQAEGAALERELRQRLEGMADWQRELEEWNRTSQPALHQRLQERLQELLGTAESNPARLAEEAAYLAARSDISEELTRLSSHTQQFERLLGAKNEIGKQLDFLLQEMNREANTLLSKASGLEEVGLKMTRAGLEIKAEIERLREQVQNVE